jgi:hypothetical protein
MKSARKSIDAAHCKLEEAILYIERNSELKVKSITFFPISSSHSDLQLV